MTPSVLPTTSLVSGAAGGTGRAAASSAATTAPGYDPSIIATITSVSVGGTSSGYIVLTVVDATGAADSSVRLDVGSGITSIAS